MKLRDEWIIFAKTVPKVSSESRRGACGVRGGLWHCPSTSHRGVPAVCVEPGMHAMRIYVGLRSSSGISVDRFGISISSDPIDL